MPLEHFNKLLKDLGTNIGYADLQANSKGLCSLRFDDRLTIDLECDEKRDILLLSSLIGIIKDQQKEKIYAEMLEANLLWAGTGGATLGVDPGTLTVFLCHQQRLQGMSFPEFQKLVKEFSSTSLYWNKRLLEGTPRKEIPNQF